MLSHEEIYLNICRNVRGVLTFVIHYIYIYIYIVIVSLFVIFKRQIGWYSLSMLLNFAGSGSFAGEAQVLGDISILILLYLVWTSDIFSSNPKNVYFLEDSAGNKHSLLANQSQIISYSSNTF